MQKHLLEVMEFWRLKVFAGLLAMVFNENFFMLLTIFLLLSALDCYTRWCANSASLWKHMYPQTPAGLWTYTKRIYHTWKWRWISSAGLRQGFADKYLVYLLLLLASSLVDAALVISKAHVTNVSSIVVMFLSLTEFISICENLSECGVGIVGKIKTVIQKRLGEAK